MGDNPATGPIANPIKQKRKTEIILYFPIPALHQIAKAV